MWNCCLTGVWSSLGAGKVPHHTTRVVICILLSDTQYLWNSTNISTNSETTMLSSLGGWLFSGFLFTVFTWGPPCHVVLSFSNAAKYARRFSKEIVLFLFCAGKDLSVWHQTDNKSYYWAHHSTPQPICLPLFMFKFWNPSPFTRKLSRQFVVFLRDLELRGHWGGLWVFPINSMRRLFNFWRKLIHLGESYCHNWMWKYHSKKRKIHSVIFH